MDPRIGRVISRELMPAELSLLKRFNVNAIRTSHHPNDPAFLWHTGHAASDLIVPMDPSRVRLIVAADTHRPVR